MLSVYASAARDTDVVAAERFLNSIGEFIASETMIQVEHTRSILTPRANATEYFISLYETVVINLKAIDDPKWYMSRSWFSDGMTVLRKNKGRRWCIIYAGSEDGWAGNPSSADHHENMNASMFEKHMTALCQWCKENYHEKKVVFCMDNTKYHRREYQANPAQHVDMEAEHIATIEDYLRVKHGRRNGKLENNPVQKSLSQLNKED
ncbi:hypothetical protein BGZ98_000091 [Dissophora globulifera]|nr:hypothetical protein BGZ98_000091 [Dissophora globulifera]